MLTGGSNTFGKLIDNNNNAALTWYGRWVTNGDGKQSGWLGSYVKFKVKNTSNIRVFNTISTTDTTSDLYQSYYVDSIPNRMPQYTLYAGGAILAATTKYYDLPITNDGQWHELKIYGYAGTLARQIGQTGVVVINSFQLDAGGQIAQSTIGAKRVQVIGDSWMGASVNWTRRLDNASYDVYPIAANGITCSVANTNYNLDFTGITNTTDPNCDAVIISYGVNDFNASVTTGAFQTALLALVDKVRLKQPTAKIFLLRVPSNTVASKAYGQYGANMSTIAGLRSNVVYLDTTSLDATTTWDSDTGHLSANSVIDFESWIETQLIANGI